MDDVVQVWMDQLAASEGDASGSQNGHHVFLNTSHNLGIGDIQCKLINYKLYT